MTPWVAFTVAARNFIPHARVLHDTLRRHHPGVQFVLGLCDTLTGFDPAELGFEVLDLPALHDDRVWGMAERYNITELCTAIKPLLFRRLMARFPGAAIVYLDPDIHVTGPMVELQAALDAGAEVVLTPHRLQPDARLDHGMLAWGAYNLGFLAVRDTPCTRRLVAWWADRLEHDCVYDPARGLFLDQKWADLFPSLAEAHVLRHPGYNVAWWNLPERTVRFGPDGWTADVAPLRFVHYSGHDLFRPAVFSKHVPGLDRHALGDLLLLQSVWRDAVLEAGYVRYGRLPFAFRWHGPRGANVHALEQPAPDAGHGAIDLPLDGELSELAVRSWEEWQAAAWHDAEPARRADELALLQDTPASFTLEGTCSMCRTGSVLNVGYAYSHDTASDGRPVPNWREHLDCRCGFQNRLRAAMHFLIRDVQPAATARIYVTEAVTPLYKWLKLRWPGTQGSEYLGPQHMPGVMADGVRHEDLCRLSFPDAAFDVVLSFEVLEHVADLEAALRECHRVLRPGGVLLFAAPMQLDGPDTVDRARVHADGMLEHLLPPEIHGNPLDPAGSLCMRYLGLRVLDTLRGIGFSDARCHFYWSRAYGYLGKSQNIVLALK